MSRLKNLKVIVNVADLAHVEPTIRALEAIQECTHEGIDAEIIVAPGISVEFAGALGGILQRLRALSK